MAVEVEEEIIPGEEVEVKKGEKKHSIKATVLDSFTQLANNNESTRINGGVKLLGYLFTNNVAEEAEKEASYALNRLIRGIATNRPSARQGFFTTLTVYLNNQPDITVTSLLKVLNKELQVGGQSKGETGELCTGHVLACGAVLRSGLFLRSSAEEQGELISALLTAANRKAYLGLVAYSFIVDFVNTNSEEDVTEKLWPHLKEALSKPLLEHTLDSLYCLLAVGGKFPSLTKKVIKKKMGLTAIFCPETVSIICDKLMNAPDFPSVNHPIYETFGKELSKSKHLVLFWQTGLETKLSLRNQNRPIIALTILDAVLKNITEHSSEIPFLFSDMFIPNILQWFKGFKSAGGKMKKYRGKQQRYEDEEENDGRKVILKAKDVFDTLIDTVKKESIDKQVSVEVLKKLLFYPGDIMFGEITNSRVIKSLTEEMNADGVKEFADILKQVISNESRKVQMNKSERAWTNTERLRAAEMFTHLVNHKATADNIKWRVKKMQFLLRFSIFKTSGDNELASVSTELAAAVKKCFFRCLNFTLPKLETLLKVLSSLVDYTDEYLSDEVNLRRLTKPISPKTLESWKAMRKFTKKLVSSSSSDSSKANTVFQILSLHSGLFLFADVMSEEMAASSLQEVQSCYDHYINDRKGRKKKVVETKEGDIVDEEPEWIEVLVDVFLNFLSRDSFLLRSVVQCVFRLLCEYLTPSAIGQIVSVLDPDSDVHPLSHHRDQSDEEGADSGSDEEEMLNGDADSEEGEDAEDETFNEDDESSGDEDVDNTTVTDQLRMAVQKALGSALPETDTESIDADNIGEEEGKELDKALSSAFKLLKQSKGKKTRQDKKNDKVLMDFRTRVLDLLDIYLEKEPSMELCLGMLSPLSRCLEFSIKDSNQQALEAKVRKCLKCLTSVKSFSSTEGVTSELLAEYLQAITSRGNRTQFVFQALGDVVSKCSTFIVRCSQKIKLTETPSKKKKKYKSCPVVELYKESLATFFTKRDSLLPVILFHEVLQLTWEGNWQILPIILQHSFADGVTVRQFRKNEGLEMINLFYKNLKRNLRTESAQEISAKLKPIEEKLSELVLTVFKNNKEVNERFFALLMKLFGTIKNYHSSVKESVDSMSWEELKPIVQECRQCIKLKNTSDYFKFCQLLGLEKIKNKQVQTIKKVEQKDSTDSGHDSNTDSDTETKPLTKKGKKKKLKLKQNGSMTNGDDFDGEHSKDKKHKKPIKRVKKEISKKEAKELRAQASSEGLEVTSFSNLLEANIDVDDIGEHTIDSDDNTSNKRKQRTDDTQMKNKSKKMRNDS